MVDSIEIRQGSLHIWMMLCSPGAQIWLNLFHQKSTNYCTLSWADSIPHRPIKHASNRVLTMFGALRFAYPSRYTWKLS